MTSGEWVRKRFAVYREWVAARDAGDTDLDFEAWRIAKGYIVDHVAGSGWI